MKKKNKCLKYKKMIGVLAVNPIYFLVGFLVFYYLIAKPFFSADITTTVLLYIVVYVIYINFGDSMFSKIDRSLSKFGIKI